MAVINEVAQIFISAIRDYPYQYMFALLTLPLAGLASLRYKRDSAASAYAVATAVAIGALIFSDIINKIKI